MWNLIFNYFFKTKFWLPFVRGQRSFVRLLSHRFLSFGFVINNMAIFRNEDWIHHTYFISRLERNNKSVDVTLMDIRIDFTPTTAAANIKVNGFSTEHRVV